MQVAQGVARARRFLVLLFQLGVLGLLALRGFPAERLGVHAIICLFCGYNTQLRTVGQTKKVVATTGTDWAKWTTPGIICALGILGLALYPQLILKRTDGSVSRAVAAVKGPSGVDSKSHARGAEALALDESRTLGARVIWKPPPTVRSSEGAVGR